MRSVEQLSEGHRRDLTVAAQHHAEVTRARMAVADGGGVAPEAVRSVRRSGARRSTHVVLGQHVGHWLIRVGTRLGGTSMQTS